MNKILQLKGQFYHRKNQNTPGAPRLPVGQDVEAEHLIKLKAELESILRFWEEDTKIKGALVGVYYRHVVAKSNRLKGLLCLGGSDPNDSIRGSKFHGADPKHVFIHYVKLDVLKVSIARLDICIDIVNKVHKGKITSEIVESIGKNEVEYKDTRLVKTNFLKVIVDAHYVEKFDIDQDSERIEERSIITLYRTDVKTTELLNSIGIRTIEAKTISENTLRLDPNELEILREKAPYLIAMWTYDLAKIPAVKMGRFSQKTEHIPPPGNEPAIGVIDTLFDENVYFSEWVTYTRMVDESIETDLDDCVHGTAVTSIIVNGPSLNPALDDGCGRFKVKHFGVSIKGQFSSFSILKAIREIVAKNRDIKVWNFSLGSLMEINKNFISPEAAELDKIQSEYDVVFVVAGTNKSPDDKAKKRIGAPADSLNSIVVNAVDSKGQPASYHRIGPVLSFFHKPDISYFGGDHDQELKVWTPYGEGYYYGTSLAAPWISRKLAYLIHTMGCSREVAKALLIDAAAKWDRKDDVSLSIGYGVVPIRIEDILQTPEDEIRFIITGSSEDYETYTYSIPVPAYNKKHPFFARATLCYFPRCVRDQGVDYTSTEMDIHFGRISGDIGKGEIKSINSNKQGDEGFNPLKEVNARKLYRKWDNIKHINDTIKTGSKPRKAYETGLWGLSIKTKERLKPKFGKGLKFGVVVTLKEMNGENRIEDFIKHCQIRGWIVNTIDIESQLEVFVKAEEEVELL